MITEREKERYIGWGMINGAAASLIAWGILFGLGHEPSFGLVCGSMGVGVYKVVKNSVR